MYSSSDDSSSGSSEDPPPEEEASGTSSEGGVSEEGGQSTDNDTSTGGDEGRPTEDSGGEYNLRIHNLVEQDTPTVRDQLDQPISDDDAPPPDTSEVDFNNREFDKDKLAPLIHTTEAEPDEEDPLVDAGVVGHDNIPTPPSVEQPVGDGEGQLNEPRATGLGGKATDGPGGVIEPDRSGQ